MTDESGHYRHLEFNAPLSGSRADRLAADLAEASPRTFLDIGCGWGELLLRTLLKAPEATGVGIDIDGTNLERARSNASARGLAERVSFFEADARKADPADVVFCVGSAYALDPDPTESLRALRGLTEPGGRLLLGHEYREREPTDSELAAAGTDFFGELTDLPTLVDLAVDAGFRPLRIETASRDEMDAFESGYLADWEHWLLDNPDDPRASEFRRQADEHRTR